MQCVCGARIQVQETTSPPPPPKSTYLCISPRAWGTVTLRFPISTTRLDIEVLLCVYCFDKITHCSLLGLELHNSFQVCL